MEIVAFHRHAVTEARRHLKPSIPEYGAQGIPIAHELELELRLQPRRRRQLHSETTSKRPGRVCCEETRRHAGVVEAGDPREYDCEEGEPTRRCRPRRPSPAASPANAAATA